MTLRLLVLVALALLGAQYVASQTITLEGCGICGGSKSKSVDVPLGVCHGIRQSDFCKNGHNFIGYQLVTFNEETEEYEICHYWDSACLSLLACSEPAECDECIQPGDQYQVAC